jgi:hypothetical protein
MIDSKGGNSTKEHARCLMYNDDSKGGKSPKEHRVDFGMTIRMTDIYTMTQFYL